MDAHENWKIELRRELKAAGMPLIEVGDIVYATYGEGDESRWLNLTKEGTPLAEKVKSLLLERVPHMLNHDNLCLSHDPAPGTKKKLRFKLANGQRFIITEGNLLALRSARPTSDPPI